MIKVLVVVDAQNDFIDGALRNEEAIKRVPNIVKEIKEGDWDLICMTQDTHYSDSYKYLAEGERLPIEHCIKGTHGWEIQEDVYKAVTETTENFINIEKSAFGSFELAKYLVDYFDTIDTYDLDSEEVSIELVGFCTDICVISNAMLLKAVLIGAIYNIQVKESCCAGITPESHKNALEAMKMCHIDII